MKLQLILLICCLFLVTTAFGQADSLYSQSYLSKSSRFAWLTFGGDLNYLSGGTTQKMVEGSLQSIAFGSTIMPRLTIGGIHFWGHADFYVSFPLSFLSLQSVPTAFSELEVYQGVETGMRLYPLKLQSKRISPFVGISFRRFSFSQTPENSLNSKGEPSYGRFIHPIQTGLTYTSNKWHISASTYFNHQNEFTYFISPQQQAKVRLDPFSFNLSLLRYIDTDRNLRSKRAVSQINLAYEVLKEKNRLSCWFLGIGPSSALQMSKSPFLKENFNFLYDTYSASILPDLSFGRYFHKVDANLNLSYRTYGDRISGFDTEIETRRHSIGLESVKFLFNYLGFVPFLGPIVSYENLYTSVNDRSYREEKLALGITFGWDIRVTKTGTGLLRTNLRYYPDLSMNINQEKMMFDHLEFNFIQWVQFIGRKQALRAK